MQQLHLICNIGQGLEKRTIREDDRDLLAEELNEHLQFHVKHHRSLTYQHLDHRNRDDGHEHRNRDHLHEHRVTYKRE